MKTLNTFTDKIISDLDNSVIKSNQWVFPTVGLRVFNKNGKGLIASVVPGNELFFEVTEGYIIVGACEYGGILYLACHNQTTGKGELGSYPSPVYPMSSIDGAFQKQYGSLTNFIENSVIRYFRTTRFNFSLDYPVDMITKLSYDGSVDLYLCDFNNPNRVINTGFNQQGQILTERLYMDSNFNGSLNLIPTCETEIITNSALVNTGGYLRPGNIFIYVRYLTQDYAKTSFIKEIGPFSISYGDHANNHMGLAERDWINDIKNETDKKIDIVLDRLDSNYKYLQIGVVRYTALQENGAYQKDVYLIDQYYPITGSYMNLTIYGNESQQLLTFDDIIKPTLEYNISKSHTQVQSRYLPARMKKSILDYDRDFLIEFASKIEIGEFQIDMPGLTTFPAYGRNTIETDHSLYQYDKADNIYRYLGYFKDQIYPFAIVFKFINGTYSEAFPCKGNIPAYTGRTEKGLYKFKSWKTITGTTFTQKKISGVQFNTTTAYTYYNTLSESVKADSFGSVVGFYFTRGERIENLICQGVSMRGFHSIETHLHKAITHYTPGQKFSFQTDIVIDDLGNGSTIYNPGAAAIMPLFEGNLPLLYDEEDLHLYGISNETGDFTGYSDHMYGENSAKFYTLPTKAAYVLSNEPYDNKHGIFSPDILFENEVLNVPDDCYLEPLIRWSLNDQRFAEGTSPATAVGTLQYPYISLVVDTTKRIYPRTFIVDLNEDINAGGVNKPTYYTQEFIKVKTTFVDKLQGRGKYNFSAYFAGKGDQVGFDCFGTLYNRNIGTSRYIGVQDISSEKKMRQLYTGGMFAPNALSTVNIYRFQNTTTFATDTNKSYTVSSSFYSVISPLIKKTNWMGTTPIQCFNGDCFLQKTWFRSHRWYAMEQTGSTTDADCVDDPGFASSMKDNYCYWYQHGLMVGIVTENKYNTGMRNEVVGQDTEGEYLRYTFFPKSLGNAQSTYNWTVIDGSEYLNEAFQINDGYNHILSDRKIKGYDFTEPTHEDEKPNRIYISDKHIPGSFLDGYRNIQIGSYQDFAVEDGPITAILKDLDYPFVVHENGINQIFIGGQKGETGDSGDLILGVAGNFLNEVTRKLAEYGSQHKYSLIQGKQGTYGFDFNKRILWRVNSYQTQGGGFYLQAVELSEKLLVQKAIQDIIERFSTETDVSSILPDAPLRGMGIVGGYDPDFKEMMMTFLLPQSSDSQNATLVFDEITGGFRGMYPFTEPKYMNLGTMFLSLHHTMSDQSEYIIDNKVYRYNIPITKEGKDNYNVFFGEQKTFSLSFIVSGISEDPQTNAVKLKKVFESLLIECKDEPLFRILYETMYQTGTYEFQTDGAQFWLNSIYEEHKYSVPVVVQTGPNEDQFEENSQMRGLWMKITIEYKGAKDIEIKSVETNFDPSFS